MSKIKIEVSTKTVGIVALVLVLAGFAGYIAFFGFPFGLVRMVMGLPPAEQKPGIRTLPESATSEQSPASSQPQATNPAQQQQANQPQQGGSLTPNPTIVVEGGVEIIDLPNGVDVIAGNSKAFADGTVNFEWGTPMNYSGQNGTVMVAGQGNCLSRQSSAKVISVSLFAVGKVNDPVILNAAGNMVTGMEQQTFTLLCQAVYPGQLPY